MANSCQPRPQIHITAPTNWLNDPNAPLYFDGRWHVFYQYNPDAPRWGLMRWGHAVSADLLRWTDAGVALRPEPGRADADGVWSGSARIIDGQPVFFYTGAQGEGDQHEQSVLRAVATNDELTTLTPDPSEPVLRIDHVALGTLHQRDPYLVRRGDRWLMLLGTGLPEDGGGAVAAWESEDTLSWSYRGLLSPRLPGSGIEVGPVWECPQLIEVDGRWILLVSVQAREADAVRCLHVIWFVGHLDDVTFVPEAMGVLDHGDCFYATAIAEGVDSVILWGWLQEALPADDASGPQHVGALSIPRELFLTEHGVGLRPAAALDALWADPIARVADVTVETEADYLLAKGLPPAFRVRLHDVSPGLVVDIGGGEAVGEESVRIGWNGGDAGQAWVSCGIGTEEQRRFSAGLPASPSGPIDMDILVDTSIVEVFIAGHAFTFRLRPGAQAERSVTLRAPARAGQCASAEVQTLAKS